jgi:glycosyltransferase involved in cell wall biosynthesis
MQKTLVFIADAGSPHTIKWVEGCAPLGWRIVVISHWPGEITGAEVIVHPLPLTGFWRYAWRVRRIIKQLKPDIVHAHQFGAHALYAWFSGCKPLVISAWGSDILVRPRQSRFYRWLIKFLIPKASIITSVSNQVMKGLIDLGARPERILTFPMGITRREYEKLRVDVSRKIFIICSPRLHEPIYNIKLILTAFARITADFPEVELWLLGNGGLTRGLQRYATENQLQRVVFWGRLSPAGALEKIARSSVMVSIPSSDGTPVSMLEAMAAGSLPVVSDLPVYHDWIVDGENGLIVSLNVDDLAAALRRSIEDKALRERAARQNRDLIKERAIWEEQFERMLECYRA